VGVVVEVEEVGVMMMTIMVVMVAEEEQAGLAMSSKWMSLH
jgi:hypothetical protein